jgi:hypothetical protein
MNDYQFKELTAMLNAIRAEMQKQTEILAAIREQHSQRMTPAELKALTLKQ